MIDIPVKHAEDGEVDMHPALQFLILIGIFIGALFAGTFLGIGIVWAAYGEKSAMAMMTMNTAAPNFAQAIWIVQIAGTTLPILGAALFFAFVIIKNPQAYLRPYFKVSWVFYLLIFALMFTSAPLMEYLANINQKFNLPHWMREDEDAAAKLTGIMLDMKSIWDLLYDVLVIGLVTAIAEEFLFRGCIQTIFLRWTKNMHVAVWVTAILFSAFHMEFFGFLPRLLLGVIFGYATAWSGSVWPAVWAHFINNATDVIVTYLEQHKAISSSFDKEQVFSYSAYIFSFIIVLFLLWIYRNVGQTKRLLLQ
jgi:membrane protease YdiL (CAAX protease family)